MTKENDQHACGEEISSQCSECGGTGLRDLGGFHPWGEPTMTECDCGAIPKNEGERQ